MTDDLIAYLMDDLAQARRAEVEENLASDPKWKEELERLRACLESDGGTRISQDEQRGMEPEPGLMKKTCCYIEDSASGKFSMVEQRARLIKTTSRRGRFFAPFATLFGFLSSATDLQLRVLAIAMISIPVVEFFAKRSEFEATISAQSLAIAAAGSILLRVAFIKPTELNSSNVEGSR